MPLYGEVTGSCVPLHKTGHGTLLEDELASGSRARSTQNGSLGVCVAI